MYDNICLKTLTHTWALWLQSPSTVYKVKRLARRATVGIVLRDQQGVGTFLEVVSEGRVHLATVDVLVAVVGVRDYS